MRKNLRDISWQVDEDTYRKDNALSYSILSRFEREGFNGLEKLFDRVESPSLTFGSAVDSIITGGYEEFNSKFLVAEYPTLPDTVIQIIKAVFSFCKDSYTDIRDIPQDMLLDSFKDISWNNHWKPSTRANKIKEDGEAYYRLLYMSEKKTIINSYTYNDICRVVSSLKESPSTRYYFEEDSPYDDNVERLYQLKFKTELDNIPYRCMADLLIVIHDRKIVIPVDLKTSSKPEWDFYKSFVDWNYSIQARLYWRIIRKIMNKDSYFKEFTLTNYRFIAANKKTLTPLVWEYFDANKYGTLTYSEGIKCKDPQDLGQELYTYLNDKYRVPIGITLTGRNNLNEWLRKM